MLTRNTNGRFAELWRRVDEASAEVATWPAWKRGTVEHWSISRDRERLIDTRED